MFERFADQIDEKGINAEIVAEIIKEHSALNKRTRDRHGRYIQAKGDDKTPILTRFEKDEKEKEKVQNKINNKLANDYFGEIIDTKQGYMFGTPISYMYDKEAEGYEAANDMIKRFRKTNNIDDLNAEFGKFAALAGYDAGLLYVDKEGQERVMRVNPWEAVIISKTEITEPEYGLRYYETWDDTVRAVFYDKKNKYVFEGKDFSAASLSELPRERKPHMFDYCPMFGVPNNAELQGDADKVLTLIDGYDRSISDMNSEIEQFRLAYLIFVGYEPDEEQLQAMIKTGALWIPDAANGEKIEWLTKNLDPKYIDSHLDRLEANITRFAKHVNFTDAAFGSDITGPAMRYKLFALETKSKTFERKHEAAMLYMFKVLGSAWAKKGVYLDHTLLDLQYTRNIPVNIVDEANAASTLASLTSKRTALGTLSVVDDVDAELDRIAEEKEDEVDLDDADLLNNRQNGQQNNQGEE